MCDLMYTCGSELMRRGHIRTCGFKLDDKDSARIIGWYSSSVSLPVSNIGYCRQKNGIEQSKA